MRYYKIVITDQNGKLITTPSSVPGSGATYTSYANNQTLPGALQVELDVPLAPYATPMGGSIVRVWGVTQAEISQSTRLNPKFTNGVGTFFNIAIYGGMQKGLPLANASQSGLLVAGSIQQSVGNWVGTDMTLDFILAPFFGSNAAPKNITFNWPANTPLKTALAKTLTTAFPTLKQNVQISANVVLNHDEQGFYSTLEQFAVYVKQLSAGIVGGSYPGIDIFLSNDTFNVYDQSTANKPIGVAFQDLIGQPTWIGGEGQDSLSMQFKCPMRGDIAVGDYIRMPKAIVTTTAAPSTALVNLKSAFEGAFIVTQLRHVGNFRQADAASWVSTFNATPTVVQPAS